MKSEAADETKARVVELASLGIRSQAAGDYQASRDAWLVALDYAEQHLPGDTTASWIRSGLGDALLKCGDYSGALEMAGSALDYCASVKAPLAALTMVRSFLELGDVIRARQYARQAYDLRGEEVFKSFSLADRAALGLARPT